MVTVSLDQISNSILIFASVTINKKKTDLVSFNGILNI